MKITRLFTVKEKDPYANLEWVERESEIRNPDGTVIFQQTGGCSTGTVVSDRNRHNGTEIFP